MIEDGGAKSARQPSFLRSGCHAKTAATESKFFKLPERLVSRHLVRRRQPFIAGKPP